MTLVDMIQINWKERKVPSFSGVLFADGRIVLFSGTSTYVNSKPRVFASPLADSTLDSFLRYHDQPWSTCTEVASCISDDGEFRLVCGEGVMGSDGFVALVAHLSGRMHWVASFGFSNPFDEVYFQDGFAHAINEYEQVWRFPMRKPEDVEISDWVGQ